MRKPNCGMQSRRGGGSLPLLLVLVLATSGCATLPKHVDKTITMALPNPATTSLGRMVAAEEVGKNLSGIRLLTSGEEALGDLIALADHAERTLDIQYYIIHEDESARILLNHRINKRIQIRERGRDAGDSSISGALRNYSRKHLI